jgi:hypothetical protein
MEVLDFGYENCGELTGPTYPPGSDVPDCGTLLFYTNTASINLKNCIICYKPSYCKHYNRSWWNGGMMEL